MQIKPIAHIRTDFTDKFGIPRQSGRAQSLVGRIIFEPEYKSAEAIRGIEDFSHLWLIFGFSEAIYDHKSLTVRPPRLGGNKRVGVFATRSPFRPNSLGLSAVKLENIVKTEKDGNVIVVSGVDMLDNTPIYDIKPYLPYADCIEGANGSFADEMSGYSLEVIFPGEFLCLLDEDKRDAAIECLADDPRPSYHDDARTYSMSFAGCDIHFVVEGNTLTVTGIDKINEVKK